MLVYILWNESKVANIHAVVMPSSVQLEIVGHIKEHNFHVARNLAEVRHLYHNVMFSSGSELNVIH